MNAGIGELFTLKTHKHSDGIFVTVATGTANAAFAMRLRFQILAELERGSNNLILDISGIDKFERDASKPFVDVLGTFKERGGKSVIVIANDGLKMMLSSISMSSVASGGPSLEIVASIQVALMRLGKAGKS